LGDVQLSDADGFEPKALSLHDIPSSSQQAGYAGDYKPGDVVNHYRILEKIGEGGCGVVYMAEQQKSVRRLVALKVIKLGMDTKSVIARFEAEQQALAMMEHSNIATVLEAGITETGRSYFAMELVRGMKITNYCDRHKLSFDQRLDLFVKVCHAVQHAHDKGIIHRDIKPSNILVTEQDGTPEPKVIDFGLAKATTDQPLTDKSIFTARDQFIGTPAYMSPEQAGLTGPKIDTRTDIYSLGVLLYELLVGYLPFAMNEFPQNAMEAILHAIRENEPARPSIRLNNREERELAKIAQCRQTEPPRLLQLLRGDIDCIVMKCLEKDRTRRYQTANDLAAEIQHYLKSEPITARPPSSLYRFQKFVQRNRLLFAAAAVVLVVLILGFIGFWIATSVQVAKKIPRLVEPAGTPTNIQSPPLLPPPSTTVPSNSSKIAPASGQSIPTWGGTGGQIRISSGTGSFTSVSDANNTLNVSPGATLNGTIQLSVLNLGPSDAVAPLIYTPSWGDHSSSWRLIKDWIPTGQSEQQAQVSLVAPNTPGVYHILFAVCWEIGGDHVASATTWGLGKDTWNDGNDIAEFSAAQLSSAQLNGWTTNSEMYGSDSSHSTTWYQERYYPADAITVVVTGGGSTAATEPTIPQSASNQTTEGNPQINSVEFRKSAGSYILTINGSGFGTLPRQALPFQGDTLFFRIAVAAQIGFGEWGFSGDAKGFLYESWSDTQIQIAGLEAQTGDAIQIALWNPASDKGATWGGNIPGGIRTPRITSVTFSGSGESLQIIVHGTGFGNAPVPMPYSGDLNQFILGDLRTHCGGGSALFEAGAGRWGHGSPDLLTLNYQSWSDNEIVISGFAGSYGQDCYTVQNGDPVTIIIWNSSASDQTGPQTAWGGFVH
jgi:serine/threonine protein kinase